MKKQPSAGSTQRQVKAIKKALSKRQNRRSKPGQKKQRVLEAVALEGLEKINLLAAGIDLGSQEHYVAVPVYTVGEGEAFVRSFGVFSAELDVLVEWLKACGITTVAMEATGIYWMALYDKLEAAQIEVVLVEPGSVKQVPGRKSDVLDCQWLQQLHTYGLLRGSFRPEPEVRRLRTLTRQRMNLVERASQSLQHMEKALLPMNLQLHLVVSDLNSETGLRIIEAILAGERDPQELVKLRDPRCRKSTVEEMKQALCGHYTEENLFVLGQSLEDWRFAQKQLAACDREIAGVLARMPSAPVQARQEVPPKPVPAAADAQAQLAKKSRKKKSSGHNAFKVDEGKLKEQLIRICGINLMQICGLNLLSVVMLIAEIGVDMSRWPNAKAFCSWLGLCPGTKISGGKVLSRRTRKVVNRAATILRVAAMAVGKTDSWLGRFYRRKKAHIGAAKATTATARKLACVLYHMLKYQEEYVPLDVALYELKAKENRMKRLRKEAEEMGLQLVENPTVA